MAVGLASPTQIEPVEGIRVAAVDANIRRTSGPDLAIFELSAPSTVAAVFTKNKAIAAPVVVAKERISSQGFRHKGQVRALLANSGNANAGLGQKGIEDCLEVCGFVAESMNIKDQCVLPFSTGVIGENLPVDRFKQQVPNCVGSLAKDNWLPAAQAIMTTDTVPKVVSKKIFTGSQNEITITGIAKGAGMIYPNMATMLAFIATDAVVEPDYLQRILNSSADVSFNCVSIDGDTSTNDSCVLIATGASGVAVSGSRSDEISREFEAAVEQVCQQLAQMLVRDGEGVTKFVTINVTGGASRRACREVAMTVANSPLVKTALFASDPNWGRVYGAIGRASVENLQLSSLSIRFDDVEVMANGERSENYLEREAAKVMLKSEFAINIDLGQDTSASARVWTTDFSYDYVKINAEYRS